MARELEAKPFLESSAKLERIGIPGGAEADSTHIYVARVRLRNPGTYWFMAEPEGGKDQVQALGNVVVSTDDPEPGPGDPAPPSETPTLASVGGEASRITTRTPPDEILLEHSVAESLRAGIPFVVTFSTPKYCTSRTCGPTVDVVEEVARRFEDRDVRFIHVEVYEENDPAKGFNRWMREWGLETEPWTFVVGADGKIVESYEGPVSVGELEEALEAAGPETLGRAALHDVADALDDDLGHTRARAQAEDRAHELGDVLDLDHLLAGYAGPVRHLRRDERGADRRRADAVLGLLAVERVRERDDGGLRRAVDGEAGRRDRARDGGEVDDVPAGRAEVRQRLARHDHRRAQVDVELEPDRLRRLVCELAADADPGRVDEDVHSAEALDVGCDDAHALVGVGEVRRDRGRAELFRRRLEWLGAARDESQLVALLAQHAAEREADPGRAAGDERRLHRGESIQVGPSTKK